MNNVDTQIKYNRSKKGLITQKHTDQKKTSKKRGHKPPTYSKQELKDWLYAQPIFHVLYDNWKRLDFQREYTPSVDRKDVKLGYTMSNIQLMTWGENRIKGYSENKVKKGVVVIQLSRDGEYVSEYKSITEASIITKTQQSDISKCLQGTRKSAGGFRWQVK